jgi:hypothetical protein
MHSAFIYYPATRKRASHGIEVVAMKIVISVGMLIFAAAVATLAAKEKDPLALAISAMGILILAVLALTFILQPGH